MTHQEFFKLQAKNLLRDYKTQYQDEGGLYQYKPRFFNDIDDIVMSFDVNEDEPLVLMKAQHIIAKLSGFSKWAELISASKPIQEIGKLLLNNRHETGGISTDIVSSIIVEDWINYVRNNNLAKVDDETKLEIFRQIFLPSQIKLGNGKGAKVRSCGTPVENVVYTEKWNKKEYQRQAKRFAEAMKPLVGMNMPLIVDLKEELAEGWMPQILDKELGKLGYEIRFRNITAMDVLMGKDKELLDNFGEKFEIWEKGQSPTEDDDIFFRGMEGSGVFENIIGKAGRNSPCKCGSGKKFKHCCGKGEN